MRISDWSSDVCSSDLRVAAGEFPPLRHGARPGAPSPDRRMERSHIVATEPGALDREGGPHDGEAVGIVRAGLPTGEASGIFRPVGTRAGEGRRIATSLFVAASSWLGDVLAGAAFRED